MITLTFKPCSEITNQLKTLKKCQKVHFCFSSISTKNSNLQQKNILSEQDVDHSKDHDNPEDLQNQFSVVRYICKNMTQLLLPLLHRPLSVIRLLIDPNNHLLVHFDHCAHLAEHRRNILQPRIDLFDVLEPILVDFIAVLHVLDQIGGLVEPSGAIFRSVLVCVF